MKKIISQVLMFVMCSSMYAQTVSKNIVVDQIGYLPNSAKVAVLRDPHVGFDYLEPFTPGSTYALVDIVTGEHVYTAEPVMWNDGKTDESSGDKVWHFDFSSVTSKGNYYILDVDNYVRSYVFEISPAVYNDALKQVVRTFFYQRAGCAKEAKYAGVGWADAASHVGYLQDKNCRIYNDRSNAATEKDLHGGWYDAGDFNKYTSWTASYVSAFMMAYMEKPGAFGDDYNIPESGNGIPDLLDEAKWGLDFLLRMQNDNGSVLSIVALSHASPPSSARGQSKYGPANTSATRNAAAAYAISSKVYRSIGMTEYADDLLQSAKDAWDWAEANPDSIFSNRNLLGAGEQETGDKGRAIAKLRAACYLFDVTQDTKYRDAFDSSYRITNLFQYGGSYIDIWEAGPQDIMLYYTSISGATQSVVDAIKNGYTKGMTGRGDQLKAYTNKTDPYYAHISGYNWGSNSNKSQQGTMFYDMINYNMDASNHRTYKDAAAGFIHYLHGVNPLNMCYLTNMYDHKAENCANEIFHSWFRDGSKKWDRAGASTYGPPPGFLPGGPNSKYKWDGCCDGGDCAGGNSTKCIIEDITPPLGQPDQKSYKDFNTDWPLNSWSISEVSCGGHINYIRLLSKFVEANIDCNGDVNGTADYDMCGICSGGNTGRTPEMEPCDCPNTSHGLIDVEECKSYTSPSGKYTWSESGVYKDTILSSNNCDSVIIINLSIGQVNTLITQVDGETLIADENDAYYQWFNCENSEYSLVIGARSQEFKPEKTGSYAVRITKDGCTEMSECFNMNSVGIYSNSFERSLKIYPNPTKGVVNVSLPEVQKEISLSVFDLAGQEIFEQVVRGKKEFSIELDIPEGIYFMVIKSSSGQKAILKFLKEE